MPPGLQAQIKAMVAFQRAAIAHFEGLQVHSTVVAMQRAAIAHFEGLQVHSTVVAMQRAAIAHFEERSLADASPAQVERVLARWRPRFRLYESRRSLLRRARTAADVPPPAARDEALVVGLLEAAAWRAEHWDEIKGAPSTAIDAYLRRYVLCAADRWLRRLGEEESAPAWRPLRGDLPAVEPPRVAVRLELGALWHPAPPAVRRLIDQLRAEPALYDDRIELARRLGVTRNNIDQLIHKLKRLAKAR